MRKRLAFFLGFILVASKAKARSVYEDVMCPVPKLCPSESTSSTCKSVEQFFHMKLGVCPGCGTCVETDAELDVDGCPVRTCPTPTMSNDCDFYRTHKQYIIYNSKICPDCDAHSCHVHLASLFSREDMIERGDGVGIAGDNGVGPGR